MAAGLNSPFDLSLALAREFEEAGIPYAIGGALAYNIYAVARATIDIDINAFVDMSRIDDIVAAAEAAGVEFDKPKEAARARQDGMLVGRCGYFRVDIFLPSIDFSWEAERTRVAELVEGQTVYFLSAEALCVFKLLFNRGKDYVDLERLVATQQGDLDRDYVRTQLVEMMGEDDERVAKWDALCREFPVG